MHSIAQREKVVCSIQVCEIMIRILELLIDMGILHQHVKEEQSYKNTYLFSLEQLPAFQKIQKMTDPQTLITSSVFRYEL